MVEWETTIERRKNIRYKVVEGAYAAISPGSHRLGQILDISMGGISFKYIDNINYQESRTQQEDSIFLSSIGCYVGDLPFKTIGDYEVSDNTSFNSLKARKRHVQFTELNFKQLYDLDHFLQNNVSEAVV